MQGGLTFQNLIKIHLFIVLHSSVCGAWKVVWWGLSPAKHRVATELVTNRHLFQKLYLLPNHAKFIKIRATPFLSFSCWNDFFYDCEC